jgi:serine/threonine-protein kinase
VPGGLTGATRSLVWVNRQGHEDPISAAPLRNYLYPRLSPDGTKVALDIRDQEYDIWIWDLARQTLTRLTHDPALDMFPVWTPGSRRIIFASLRSGVSNLFWQAADNTGTVDRLTNSPNSQVPTSISPDGTLLIVREVTPKTGGNLRVLRMDGPFGQPGAGPSTLPAGGLRLTEPLMQTTFSADTGEISPDGHWLAYQSNDSGQAQIYVRPFPNVDSGHWTISTSGGTKPLWARSGKELFYFDGTNALTSVAIHTGPTFSAGNPTKLFDGQYFAAPVGRTYDISPDGQRFLMIKAIATGDLASTSASIVVVINWLEELKAKVPVK